MARIRLCWIVGVCLLASASNGRADDDKKDAPTISVSGSGTISATPDIAEIQVGVRTQAATAREALASNNQAMNMLHAILKERGVAVKDVRTTQIQVSPQYSEPPRGRENGPQPEFIPRVIGYRVDNSVQVTARRIDKVGELLDALVQAGANEIDGINFRIEQADKLLDEARKRAIADAKRKADLFAGEAGVVVGPPRLIQEDGMPFGFQSPQSFAVAPAMMSPAPMAVAPGQQELRVNVHVVYELKTAR
jgi:uncharacterized protein YggE